MKVQSKWPSVRIGLLAELIPGITYTPGDIVENDGVFVIRANSIQNSRMVDDVVDVVRVSKDIPDKLRIQMGDILVCSNNGSANLVGKNARVTPAQVGQTWGTFMSVVRSEYSDFLFWVMQSRIYDEHRGINKSSTIFQMSPATISAIKVPLPPLDTQRAIADYLDRETSEIDAMLDKLDGLGRLLEERLQTEFASLTSQFRRVHLGAIATFTTGTTPKSLETKKGVRGTDSVPWIKPADLGDNADAETYLKIDALRETPEIPKETPLVCGIGATVGKVGYSQQRCTINQQITAVIPFGKVVSRYLYYALLNLSDEFRSTAGGTTMPIINNSRFALYQLPLPPLDEQERIVAHLDETTARIDAMLAKTQQLKDLLTERRSALITAAVTGQIEVH